MPNPTHGQPIAEEDQRQNGRFDVWDALYIAGSAGVFLGLYLDYGIGTALLVTGAIQLFVGLIGTGIFRIRR